jgi:hypothetical protein
MPTAGDVLLSKSSLAPGATTADHLNSIVVGSRISSCSLASPVNALSVGVEEVSALGVNIEPVEAQIQEIEAVSVNLDQIQTEVILDPIETQVQECR